MEKINANGRIVEVKDWNGKTPYGYIWENFNPEDADRWHYKIDENGNVWYRSYNGTYSLWCSAENLERHIHHLNQIAARK